MKTQYSNLAIRYLKANKKRTLGTLTGIVLSSALISTIGLFFYSLVQAQSHYLQSKYGSVAAGQLHPVVQRYVMISVVVISVVLIAAIAVIYNSFQISVLEKVRQFGLLRAIGAGKKQIRQLVLKEATILSAIGIPAGLLMGIISVYLLSAIFYSLGGTLLSGFKAYISLPVLLTSAIISLLSVYISALLPARYAGNISPLVAISGSASLKKENNKKRSGGFFGRFFGFIGALANKNAKRNIRRYRITSFSIALSVILFIVFTSFFDIILQGQRASLEEADMHFVMLVGKLDSNRINEIEQQIKKLPMVKKLVPSYPVYALKAALGQQMGRNADETAKGTYGRLTYGGQEMISVDVSLKVADASLLEKIQPKIKAGRIDATQMNSSNGVILTGTNRLYNKRTRKPSFGPLTELKEGDEFLVSRSGAEISQSGIPAEFLPDTVMKLKVTGIIDDMIYEDKYEKSLKLMTTPEMASYFTGKPVKPRSFVITLNEVGEESLASEALNKIASSYAGSQVLNQIKPNMEKWNLILLGKILIYGFVVVVSVIGIVNVFNSLTTNILLKKKQFATLKAIGMSAKKLKDLIVMEGLIYVLSGFFIGIIIATAISYFMYQSQIKQGTVLYWKIPWLAVGCSFVVTLLLGYLSSLGPLKIIRKSNVTEMIKEDY